MAVSEGAKRKESNMQFVVSKQNLQKELGFVQGVVEKKNTIPVLSNILIESVGENTIRLTGTDLDVTIRCDMDAEDISTPGSICVQARKLFEIARLLPDAPVSFKKEDNDWVTVTCDQDKIQDGRCCARRVSGSAFFQICADEDFGRCYQELLSTEQSSRSLRKSRATRSPERSLFWTRQAQRWSRLMVTGWLTWSEKELLKTAAAMPSTLLIPRKTLAELTKLTAGYEGDISLGMDENHIFFEVGPRLLISRMLYGQFPNYEMVMPKNNDKSIQFDGALVEPGDQARGVDGRRTLARDSFSSRAESTSDQFAERRRRRSERNNSD